MNRVRSALRNDIPELSAYFQSGGLVDSVLNLGLPAPIDVQVSGTNWTTPLTPPAKSPNKFAV